jgi:hypothetical protein
MQPLVRPAAAFTAGYQRISVESASAFRKVFLASQVVDKSPQWPGIQQASYCLHQIRQPNVWVIAVRRIRNFAFMIRSTGYFPNDCDSITNASACSSA